MTPKPPKKYLRGLAFETMQMGSIFCSCLSMEKELTSENLLIYLILMLDSTSRAISRLVSGMISSWMKLTLLMILWMRL